MPLLTMLWRTLCAHGQGWLLPAALMMVLFGGLFILTKSATGLPFLYAY